MSVTVDHEGPVAIIAIDRPARRNAVDHPTAEALYEAFKAFDADPARHVAILTGTGDHFCAGADLKSLSEGERRPLTPDGDFGPMGVSRLDLSKPVIAAVEGYAVAGGMELALWCDLRVMAHSAKMGIFCRRFGVPLVDLGTIRLPRLIGHSRAADLILTGREVDAAEAHAIGLANRIAPDGGALDAARKLAHEIAAFPQQCLRNDRRSMIDQWSLDMAEATAREAELGRATLEAGETQAGAARFAGGEGRHGTFD